MTLSPQKPIALADFLQLPQIDESPAWEYSHGEAVQKPMGGGKHSTLQKRLIATIDQANIAYEAFPELRCTFGGRSIVPDVVVLAAEQLPLDDEGEISSAGIEFAPPWVIEILSPAQSQTRVTGNILHCLRFGSQLGWLIDPQERSILVYPADRRPELLTEADHLPSLPDIDLDLSVEQMFSWLKRGS
jgi:Uma2 family endonuclease